MERRTFLGVAGAGLFGPALPAWLRAGFQEHGHCPNPYVSRCLERSRRLGKPTLMFVVPEEEGERGARRSLFGEFLNRCTREGLLDLSLCEVLCARQTDLAVHVRGAKRVKEPLLVLVERGGGVRFAIDELPDTLQPKEGATHPWEVDYHDHSRKRAQALEKLVRDLLLPDERALLDLAALVRRTLAADELEAISAARRGDCELDTTLADEAGALIRSLASDSPHDLEVLERVVAGTTFRVRKGPPFGATWNKSEPCGRLREGIPKGHPVAPDGTYGERSMTVCGASLMMPFSRRFLRFWDDTAGVD